MKRILSIIALFAASAMAQAAPMLVYPDGTLHAAGPREFDFGDGRTTPNPPSLETLAAYGYRMETAEEVAIREASSAQAAADAAAQAALYADPQPAVMAPRIVGTLDNVVGESQILVDGETGDVFAVDDTGSPKHTLAQKRTQDAARRAKVANAKTAKAKGNGLNALAERVAALEALNGIK